MDSFLIEQLPAGRRSLRLAVVTETWPPAANEVAATLARHVEGLRQRNHEVQLIRPRQAGAERPASDSGFAELLTGGIPIPRYPNLKLGLPAKRALIKQWTLRRPDVVHLATEGPLAWSALQAALKLKLPVCSDFRSNLQAYRLHYGLGWLRKPIVAYLRKFHNRTHLTLVSSEQMRNELAGAGFRNLRVLPRGVDSALFDPVRRSETLRQAWGATAETPVLLHVGPLAVERNLEVLAATFAAVRRRRPGARLVLVGDGPYRAPLRSQLPEAIFAGHLEGEPLAVHYASADLLLFPGLGERCGGVPLEAMASGLPVVAFDQAAPGECLRHGSDGLLAGHGRGDEFAACADELVDLHGRAREHFMALGRNARQAARNQDWSTVAGQLESLLLSLV
jgi:glycosyltransferase involved in cell wall biosynthesis